MKAIKCDACGVYVDGRETAFRRLAIFASKTPVAELVELDLCAACVQAATGWDAKKMWEDREALLAIVGRAKAAAATGGANCAGPSDSWC